MLERADKAEQIIDGTAFGGTSKEVNNLKLNKGHVGCK